MDREANAMNDESPGSIEGSLRTVFMRVRDHLLSQAARAVDADGFCMYRGRGGTKCAVGCLIPDEAYDRVMEGSGAKGSIGPLDDGTWEGTWVVRNQALANGLNAGGIPASPAMHELLCRLQRLHDGGRVSNWAEGLEDIRRDFAATGYSL